MTAQKPAGIDVTTANVARIYDYFLGGKDNFAADRAAADKITEMMPLVPISARENRAFVRRAVRFLAADCGVRQFVDVGAGLPTQGNVHDIAHEIAPDTKVVYVDNDPVVCNHGRALLAGESTRIIQADLRRPGEILDHPQLRGFIDFAEPIAVLLTAVLHFIGGEDDPYAIIARFGEVMAPGSYLVISHGTLEASPDDPRVRRSTEVYKQASATLALRPLDAVRRMFDGFELVPPGLVWISQWQPGRETPDERGATETMRGGVGRKPS